MFDFTKVINLLSFNSMRTGFFADDYLFPLCDEYIYLVI